MTQKKIEVLCNLNEKEKLNLKNLFWGKKKKDPEEIRTVSTNAWTIFTREVFLIEDFPRIKKLIKMYKLLAFLVVIFLLYFLSIRVYAFLNI